MEKMLRITYPSWGRAYPSLELSVSEHKYQENPERYNRFSSDIVEEIIYSNELEERLAEEWGYNAWTIAELVWTEMVNVGMGETIISEWDEGDYDDEDYFHNLSEEEQAEYLEEQREALLESFLQILNRDRYFYDD